MSENCENRVSYFYFCHAPYPAPLCSTINKQFFKSEYEDLLMSFYNSTICIQANMATRTRQLVCIMHFSERANKKEKLCRQKSKKTKVTRIIKSVVLITRWERGILGCCYCEIRVKTTPLKLAQIDSMVEENMRTDGRINMTIYLHMCKYARTHSKNTFTFITCKTPILVHIAAYINKK